MWSKFCPITGSGLLSLAGSIVHNSYSQTRVQLQGRGRTTQIRSGSLKRTEPSRPGVFGWGLSFFGIEGPAGALLGLGFLRIGLVPLCKKKEDLHHLVRSFRTAAEPAPLLSQTGEEAKTPCPSRAGRHLFTSTFDLGPFTCPVSTHCHYDSAMEGKKTIKAQFLLSATGVNMGTNKSYCLHFHIVSTLHQRSVTPCNHSQAK